MKTLEVASLAYMDGLKQEDIAKHLGISRKTVGKRLKKFKQIAYKLLE